jgi:hypothetical protein
VFALAVLLARLNAAPSAVQQVVEAEPAGIDRELPAAMPSLSTASMRDVLRYLDSEANSGYSVINLPERRSFHSYGEPSIMKVSVKNDGIYE